MAKVLTGLLILILSSTSSAEQLDLLALSLEELGQVTFSTSTGIEVPFDDAIGTAYSINRETIKRRGYQSLKDLLEHIPGFTVQHRDVEYVAAVRGLNSNDNQKMTLMINGYEIHGVHEPSFLNGPINLDEVEKVEVVVGPSSFFEPANTLVATVNVITRKTEGHSFSTTYGSDVDYRASGSTGKKWQEDIWVSASFTVESRKGFSAFDNRVAGTALQATEGEDWVGASDDQYHLVAQGQHGDWSGQLQIYQSRWPHLTARGALVNNPNAFTQFDLDTSIVEKIYSGSLKHEHQWNARLKTHVLARVASRESTKEPQTVDNQLWAVDYNLDFGTVYTTDEHTIQVGIQASYDDYINFQDELGQTFLNGAAQAIGFYVSDTWQLTNKIKSILGLRVDKNTVLPSEDWFWGGRAAVVYQATNFWTSKLMANHVIKMPAPMSSRQELWGLNNNNPLAPNFALQNNTADSPEQLTTLEWQNILYFNDRQGRGSITFYHQHLKDFISWGGPWTNLGDFEGFGLEGDISYKPRDSSIDYWANFSWFNSTFGASNFNQQRHAVVDDENHIIGSPEYTANAGASIEIVRNLYLSPSVRYITGQAAIDVRTNTSGHNGHRYYLDAAVHWQDILSMKNTNLRFRVRNILDNRDYVPGSFLNGEYRPRGINANISLDIQF